MSSVYDFLGNSPSGAVAFIGTVTSRGDALPGEPLDITFAVDEWILGTERRIVVVRTRAPAPSDNDSCLPGDFNASPGQQWVIVGGDLDRNPSASDAVPVRADIWVSKRVVDGRPPDILLQVLREAASEPERRRDMQRGLPETFLTAPRKYAGMSFPAGSLIAGSYSDMPAQAKAPVALSYCGYKFKPGTFFNFTQSGNSPARVTYVEVSRTHRFERFIVPPTTHLAFAEEGCTIQSLWVPWTHDPHKPEAHIDFGYVRLNHGWIELHPNGHVRRGYASKPVKIRGIWATGELVFSKKGMLRQFQPARPQVIRGIPLQSNVCTELDETGKPVHFVLSKPYRIDGELYHENDRIWVEGYRGPRAVHRAPPGGRPQSNC
jgi:hypothetical protein